MCGSENKFKFSFTKIPDQTRLKIKGFTTANTVILPNPNTSKREVHNLPSFRSPQSIKEKLPFTGANSLLLSCHLPFKILICNFTKSTQ